MAKKQDSLVDHLRKRYVGDDERRRADFEQARANADVARKVHALRMAAGLSQRELAELVGTTASVICRLEDDDYEGHSLNMLHRIAAATGNRVQIRFVRDRR